MRYNSISMVRLQKQQKNSETDSAYFLKLVLYVILGSFWLRLSQPLFIGDFALHAIPIGLALGLVFASHDHFQVDRKIEYAVLIVATIVSYVLPTGIII